MAPSLTSCDNGPATLGKGDYDGLIELQDMVNSKYSQVAHVITKHANPKLIVPPEAADEQGLAGDDGNAATGALRPRSLNDHRRVLRQFRCVWLFHAFACGWGRRG